MRSPPIRLRAAPALLALAALSGCANLDAVRDFAGETRRISLAFYPFLAATVKQCEQKFVMRRVYAGAGPIARFDAQAVLDSAAAACKPIAQKNTTAKAISVALGEYARQLAQIAGDGVAPALDGELDGLGKSLASFDEFPAAQIGAVDGLLKFITRASIGRQQRQAIEEALSHQQAVGALADALVLYTERVYAAYLTESAADTVTLADSLRDGSQPELLARLQIMELRRQQQALQIQGRAVPALHKAVDAMKATMKDLQANLDRLDSDQRKAHLSSLAKEVRALYQQIEPAFKE